ncbi:MAG TPA: DoxX family protein, partial [Castellaniella sp.]|jgi:putative oxidoreductase|nr:DoxX family protein [Castellaniella sp.]
MASLKAPFPKLATIISIALEFFACVAIALGVFTRPLALLLFLFTLGTALIGHRFWTMEGSDRYENQLNFFKNMSIMGGMLLLAITGAGRFALM